MKKDLSDYMPFALSVRARLGGRLRLLMLFGSAARGETRPDSDSDYLVVVDAVTPEINDILDDEAGKVLVSEGRVVSAFAVSETDFERYVFNPLFINIRREGIAL